MAGATALPSDDRILTLRDGRTLAYAEWGDLRGRPVLLFHGRPGSRLFCPDEDTTIAAGVRLITIDRPGYGRSDPNPGRTLLDWPGDVEQLTDRLDLPPSPIVGWSSGGPHALACAVSIPTRITMIGLAAAPGPDHEVPGAWEALPDEVRRLTELLREDPPAALDGIRKRVQWFADDPGSLLAQGFGGPDDPDDALLAQPEILEAMQAEMRKQLGKARKASSRTGSRSRNRGGFHVSDVEHQVHVWWGEQDALVNRAHTEYLASNIPGAKLSTYPGEGHLFPITHWREMLDTLG